MLIPVRYCAIWQSQDVIRRVAALQLELVFRPFEDVANPLRRREVLLNLNAVIAHLHADLFAAVAVNMMPPLDPDLAQDLFLLPRFFFILDEDEDFLFPAAVLPCSLARTAFIAASSAT